MVNFKVIENIDRVTPLLADFVELYNNPLISCEEIRSILGISTNTYQRLFSRALGDGSIRRRRNNASRKRKSKSEPRFWSYSPVNNRWQVYHHDKYYCSCKSQREAELMVEELRKVDWDKSQVKEIQFDVRGRLYYGND